MFANTGCSVLFDPDSPGNPSDGGGGGCEDAVNVAPFATTTASSDTISLGYPVDTIGCDAMLVVAVAFRSGTNPVVATARFGSIDLERRTLTAFVVRSQLFYLVDPPQMSANVELTFETTDGQGDVGNVDAVLAVTTATGVDTGAPVQGGSAEIGDTSGEPTNPVSVSVTAAADRRVVSVFATVSADSVTSNQTDAWDDQHINQLSAIGGVSSGPNPNLDFSVQTADSTSRPYNVSWIVIGPKP